MLTYRIGREGDVFELQLKFSDRWEALYRFTLEPQTRIDFEVANWFTSTHPRSLFTQNLIVCRVVGTKRVNLFNIDLSVREADERVERRILANARRRIAGAFTDLPAAFESATHVCAVSWSLNDWPFE